MQKIVRIVRSSAFVFYIIFVADFGTLIVKRYASRSVFCSRCNLSEFTARLNRFVTSVTIVQYVSIDISIFSIIQGKAEQVTVPAPSQY